MNNQFKQNEYRVTFATDLDVIAPNKEEALELAVKLFTAWLEENAFASDFDASTKIISNS